MFSRSKILKLIPAIILIPILFGMTPLNFIQKIGSGCPFSHNKQITCNPCPFNSIVSHDDTVVISLNSTPSEHNLLDPISFQRPGLDIHRSEIFLSSLPLRC